MKVDLIAGVLFLLAAIISFWTYFTLPVFDGRSIFSIAGPYNLVAGVLFLISARQKNIKK